MLIFSDFHQQDLFYSLQLLFQKRLGYNLFRPIGLEWYKEGFWKVYDHPDTAEQFLGMRQGYQPKDGTLPLNDEIVPLHDYYICKDEHNNSSNKAITLEQFKKMDIDIVIASIPQHIKPFKELAKMKGAKFIFQMGNVFPEVNLNEIPNLMANTLPQNIPLTCNYIQYHQEFDLNIFKPSDFSPTKLITNFINILGNNGGYVDYLSLKAEMPDWTFKSYGARNDDGIMNTTEEIATQMQRSAWGFHSKAMGDGYGHILYNWFACGRPIITRLSDYKDKLGEELLVDMETCLLLDNRSYAELYYIISTLPPIKYDWMCQQVHNRFLDKVNYDLEEIKIKEFLSKLK